MSQASRMTSFACCRFVDHFKGILTWHKPAGSPVLPAVAFFIITRAHSHVTSQQHHLFGLLLAFQLIRERSGNSCHVIVPLVRLTSPVPAFSNSNKLHHWTSLLQQDIAGMTITGNECDIKCVRGVRV